MEVLVMDNGASSIKVGWSQESQPRIIPNCVTKSKSEKKRVFIGKQMEECKDFSALFYVLPHKKGYLQDWDVESKVWDHVFGKDIMQVKPEETTLILTDPYFLSGSTMMEPINEILFEEYEFKAVCRMNPSTLSAFKNHRENAEKLCCLVVDCGYSFTHIVPFVRGKVLPENIRRMDIGGKLLTNHLKEVISYRQLHVMDETYVINQAKEDCCYVSTDFDGDFQKCRLKGAENDVARDYVLPDYVTNMRGFVRQEGQKATSNEQVLRMNCERFTIPELLFHPSHIGIDQMGISEGIQHVISLADAEIQPHLWRNIVLTGGSCLFPNFKERLYRDLRAMAPDLYQVNVTLSKSPITEAWLGGAMLAKDLVNFPKWTVTRDAYREKGESVCLDTFNLIVNPSNTITTDMLLKGS